MEDFNRKFTEAELIALQAGDDYTNKSDPTYLKFSADKARNHNDTWDKLEELNIYFRALTQNSFEFRFKGRMYVYYASSNKWKAAVSPKIYFCKNLEHLIEILSR